MKCQTLTALLLSGCVVTVPPTRTPAAGALSKDWSTGPDATRVMTYEPRQHSSTTSSDLALAVGLGLLVAVVVAATKEPDRRKLGRVVWEDGSPCANCLVLATISNGDDLERLNPAYCNANGFFVITIEGKSEKWWIDKYEVRERIGDQQYPQVIMDYEHDGEEFYIVIAGTPE